MLLAGPWGASSRASILSQQSAAHVARSPPGSTLLIRKCQGSSETQNRWRQQSGGLATLNLSTFCQSPSDLGHGRDHKPGLILFPASFTAQWQWSTFLHKLIFHLYKVLIDVLSLFLIACFTNSATTVLNSLASKMRTLEILCGGMETYDQDSTQQRLLSAYRTHLMFQCN